jgi:hypothetical protein
MRFEGMFCPVHGEEMRPIEVVTQHNIGFKGVVSDETYTIIKGECPKGCVMELETQTNNLVFFVESGLVSCVRITKKGKVLPDKNLAALRIARDYLGKITRLRQNMGERKNKGPVALLVEMEAIAREGLKMTEGEPI